MSDTVEAARHDLPATVIDLARRLGARSTPGGSVVALVQRGRIKRALGSDAWITFTARQSIATSACDFAWRARFGPFGMISVLDALDGDGGRLDVTALGVIPIARTPRTAALTRGEVMRYLAELPGAPDAIFDNPALRWREGSSGSLIVGTGEGVSSVEMSLALDSAGRIATTFAPDRPRSAVEPILPTPWRGHFFDYRFHLGRWIPFAGEVG